MHHGTGGLQKAQSTVLKVSMHAVMTACVSHSMTNHQNGRAGDLVRINDLGIHNCCCAHTEEQFRRLVCESNAPRAARAAFVARQCHACRQQQPLHVLLFHHVCTIGFGGRGSAPQARGSSFCMSAALSEVSSVIWVFANVVTMSVTICSSRPRVSFARSFIAIFHAAATDTLPSCLQYHHRQRQGCRCSPAGCGGPQSWPHPS